MLASRSSYPGPVDTGCASTLMRCLDYAGAVVQAVDNDAARVGRFGRAHRRSAGLGKRRSDCLFTRGLRRLRHSKLLRKLIFRESESELHAISLSGNA